jgi:DDE superfamily endonuclease
MLDSAICNTSCQVSDVDAFNSEMVCDGDVKDEHYTCPATNLPSSSCDYRRVTVSTQTDGRYKPFYQRSVGMQSDGLHVMTDSATSPVKTSSPYRLHDSSTSACDSDTDSEYNPLKDSQGTLSSYFDSQNSDSAVVQQSRAMTSHLARSNSQRYLGLPAKCLFVLDKLADKLPHTGKHCSLSSTEIVEIILRKVRINESFDIIADSYGVSKVHVSRLFSKYLPVIGAYLKDLIIWPSLPEVQKRLPLAFKTRYRNVISIIDCLEIEIQKPSKPLQQSLTWSEYKHANTVKYLISSTPDGTINFISAGYSGRISDVQLVVESGFLNCLQPGETVMADRGFKSIETKLQEKGCRLCKPPSVSKNEKLPKELVHEAKVIAALRVHIERVIRRIREFSFLAPHACIPAQLVSLTDYAIVVAAGLVNLQNPLTVA